MKEHKDFIMMVNSEKGILLAKDICKYISDPLNPMYDAATAAQEAFSLLTIPTKCPPDLMEYVINNHYIPDAQFPEFGERELVQKNADFIARHSLLYYYREIRLSPPLLRSPKIYFQQSLSHFAE